MKAQRCFLPCLAILALTGLTCEVANNCRAESILFESGTLGPTGVTFEELFNGEVPGTVVGGIFTGVRFELSEPAITTQVGGHLFARSGGTFFGAIVELENENDFPDSNNLSTSDLLGTTIIDVPAISAEVFGDLSLTLDPGWYALVFGSGLFGALGDGAAVRNGVDIGNPSYIAVQSTNWFNLADRSLPFDNHRFVVLGSSVPEPSTICLLTIPLLFLSLRSINVSRIL